MGDGKCRFDERAMDALKNAILRGDIDQVKTIIETKPYLINTGIRHDKRCRPIAICTRSPKPIELINLLLNNNAQLYLVDRAGRDLLLYACEYGAAPSTIDYVLDIDTEKRFKWSCRVQNKGHLALAVQSGNLELYSHLNAIIPVEFHDEFNHLVEIAAKTKNEIIIQTWMKIWLDTFGEKAMLGEVVNIIFKNKFYSVLKWLVERSPLVVGQLAYYRLYRRRFNESNIVDILNIYKRHVIWKNTKVIYLLAHSEPFLPEKICTLIAQYSYKFRPSDHIKPKKKEFLFAPWINVGQ